MTTDGKHISVEEASVNTVSVSLKVIQIDNKQMTLSVFRQLRVENVDDWDAMWGTVEYHHDCYTVRGPGEHFHVVWQKGNELRRDLIYFGDLSRDYGNIEDARKAWARIQALPQLFIAV